MKYVKTFESLKGEKINMDEVKFMHNKSLGYFYSKSINGNKVLVRIDNRGDFGYFVNDSRDVQDNKDIPIGDKIKIITFVKNILFYHLENYKPEKIYIHGTDFNDKNRLKKDDMYINFLSKAKLPEEYEFDREFTQYGYQNVIKQK